MSYASDRSCQVYVGFLPNHATMEDCEVFFKGYGKIKSINLKPGYGFVVFEDRRDAEDAVKDLDGGRMCGEKVDIQLAKGPGHKSKSSRRGDGRPVVRDSRRSGGDEDGERGGSRERNDNRENRGRDRGSRGGRRSRSRSPPRRGYSPPRDAFTLKITNLSTRCSWQDLKDYIRDQTKVEAAFCQAHKPVDRTGTVSFDSKSDMETVVGKMDGFEINGRKIKCEDTSRSSSGGRSRDRRRSRSRSRSRSDRRSRSKKSRSRSRDTRKQSDEPKAKRQKENGDDQNDNSTIEKDASDAENEPENLKEPQSDADPTDNKSEKSENGEIDAKDTPKPEEVTKTIDEVESKEPQPMDEESNDDEPNSNSEKEPDQVMTDDGKNDEMEIEKDDSREGGDQSPEPSNNVEKDEEDKNSDSEVSETVDSEKSIKSADS